MSQEKREIVLPSQFLGHAKDSKAGQGTFIENGKLYSEILGILNKKSGYINVTPLQGHYSAVEGDFVIGIVREAMSSSWLVDINAPYPALLYVNEVPWDVEFGETKKYLTHGDSVMAKVLQVNPEKKIQITLKDRNLYKIRGGYITDVEPSRVPRIIGRKGSMISLLKKHTRCRIFVGQNGRIWIDGDDKDITKVLYAIKKIENESLSYGLTNKIDELLRKDSKDVR